MSQNYAKNVSITLNRERYTSLKKYLANVPELYQKMPQSPNVGSVTPTLRTKDLRAVKLGVPPGLSGRTNKIRHYL